MIVAAAVVLVLWVLVLIACCRSNLSCQTGMSPAMEAAEFERHQAEMRELGL